MYAANDGGATFKKFFPTAAQASKFFASHDPSFLRTQVFTGHGANASYLARFKKRQSAECSCGSGDQTIVHLLDTCRHFNRQRAVVRLAASKAKMVWVWSDLLAKEETVASFLALIDAIAEACVKENSTANSTAGLRQSSPALASDGQLLPVIASIEDPSQPSPALASYGQPLPALASMASSSQDAPDMAGQVAVP
jgi:hypothetical protein